MAKGKNKNNTKRPANQPFATLKAEKKTEVTAETVAASTSVTEFEKNKQDLFDKLNKELKQLKTEKEAAEKEATDAKKRSETLKQDADALAGKKATLQTEFEEINSKYEEAVKTIRNAQEEAKGIRGKAAEDAEGIRGKAVEEAEGITKNAKEDADGIRTSAEKERIATLMRTAEEAREEYKTEIESLKKQIFDIATRETALHNAQMKLDQDRQAIDDKREELDALNEYVQKLKERYSSASPAKMKSLELELADAQSKYTMLLEKYDELASKLSETQVVLDTVKTEIEDSNGGTKIASMQQIVASMQEFRDKYERLAAVYEKYPDVENITALEEGAQRAQKLEIENNTLEQERNRYREEAAAARNASKELEVVHQEVEATNALNEHLLRELESHKTALESRTGDTCPSLSKVDTETEKEDFKKDIASRVKRTEIVALQEMVQHVKNYAGSRKKEEQLFYSDNDIRAFLAGMAVSRLIILQGMSGTGKSSLPRIFSEAISGFNRLIPVESSWRDRNELLGYYNDFNKKFNAKSFTIELYRSTKKNCQSIPTFIVLDEMNLARIEYYFSDFLAILQEPDHKKWLIELVSSDMRTLPVELPEEVVLNMRKEKPTVFAIWEKIERSRQGDLRAETSDEEKVLLTNYLAELGKLTGAKDLIDGRKLRVTDNIWFIGTANKDESTFEISDKVYDRAQVVSLNKKGVSEGNYISTGKKFISVDALQELFTNAIIDFQFKSEVEDRLAKLDDILIEQFDVSFGNRIVTQTIDFSAVFTAAGGKLADALDYQISTKILRKVISSDDGEALQILYDATKDYSETRRLISKRIKDLG